MYTGDYDYIRKSIGKTFLYNNMFSLYVSCLHFFSIRFFPSSSSTRALDFIEFYIENFLCFCILKKELILHSKPRLLIDVPHKNLLTIENHDFLSTYSLSSWSDTLTLAFQLIHQLIVFDIFIKKQFCEVTKNSACICR